MSAPQSSISRVWLWLRRRQQACWRDAPSAPTGGDLIQPDQSADEQEQLVPRHRDFDGANGGSLLPRRGLSLRMDKAATFRPGVVRRCILSGGKAGHSTQASARCGDRPSGKHGYKPITCGRRVQRPLLLFSASDERATPSALPSPPPRIVFYRLTNRGSGAVVRNSVASSSAGNRVRRRSHRACRAHTAVGTWDRTSSARTRGRKRCLVRKGRKGCRSGRICQVGSRRRARGAPGPSRVQICNSA